VDIIAFGNYEPSQLAEVARAIRSELGESTAEHSWRYTSDFKVTQGHHKNANISVKKDGVGIMVNYLYPEKSIAKLSQLQLLNQFFERAFFTELRTNKKLGYVAASFVRSVHDYPAFAMLVESHNTDLVSVEGHIDSFVESFLQSLIDLDEQDFVDAKQAAINNLAKKPESLAIEAKPYLSDWNKGHLGFDTAESQIKALKSTHKDDLIELYRRVFMEEMHAKDTIQIKGKNFKKTGFFCEDCAD
jgi:secreted Zn-dependent insulinase-like peptidase